jgi:hypothetical protein
LHRAIIPDGVRPRRYRARESRRQPPGTGAQAAALLAAAVLLAACTAMPPVDPAASAAAPAADSAAALLAAAREADHPQAAELALAAAARAIDDGDLGLADSALALAGNLPLSIEHAFALELARAGRARADGDAQGALRIVRPLAAAPTPELARRARLLRAAILADVGDFLAAAAEHVGAAPLLDGDMLAAHADATWTLLSRVPLPDLERRAGIERDTALQAWLAMAVAFHGSPERDRARALRDWSRLHLANVRERVLPAAVRSLLQAAATARPAAVALLLPASGPLAPAAVAVRDGFIAAALADASSTPPRITVHDTGSGDITAAYAAAVAAGADLVVGPLDRGQVAALNAAGPTLPTLALNYLPAPVAPAPGLFQFGLSPEDEAAAVAERLRADGADRVMLFTRGADWAARARETFLARFTALGGQVRRETRVGDLDAVQRAVKDALLIAESETRRERIARALGFAPEFQPRRRGDVDAVVLFADTTTASVVKPMLTYYYAADLPVYTTSHIRDVAAGRPQGNEADLEGVRFCDTPWRLGLDERRHLMQALPAANGAYASLFALGVDAYLLHARLAAIGDRTLQAVDAATGLLSSADGSSVRRAPAWARIARGDVQPLPRVAGAPPSP